MQEVVEGVVGPAKLRPPERESEEHHVVSATDTTVVLVDREPKLSGQVPRETGTDAFTGARAAHENQEVVGVAHESMSAVFQFHVEVALRRPPDMNQTPERNEMRPEYDFSGGVCGKHYRAYREGTNVVLLEPDIARACPNSEAVNRALRKLLETSAEVQRNLTKPSSERE